MKKLVAFLMAMTMILCLFAGCAAEKTDPVHTTAGLPSKEGITIPKRNVSLKNDPAADMMLLFIYQGNCYVQYEIVQGTAIKGKRLGTVTGMIDEWTPADGYVELAGCAYGDFFEVEGYDPSFMLCMNEGEDAVMTYVCDSGYTLTYGADLFEEKFQLSDHYSAMQYETSQSWFNSMGECYQVNGTSDVVDEFIRKLNTAEFMLYDSVEDKFDFENWMYVLSFKMNNGTAVHVSLYEDGYVLCSGFPQVCIKVPEKEFNALSDFMDNHSDSVRLS